MWSTIWNFFKKASRKPIFWLILLLVAAGVFIATAWLKKDIEPIQPTVVEKKKHPLLEDKDEDGLQAWEEQLYRTNPENPDTDGDGTTDGDEIKEGRSPLVAGPDDVLTDIKPAETQPGTGEEEQVNLTQELFNELLKSGGFSAVTGQGNAPLVSSIITEKVDELVSQGKLNPSSYVGFTPPPVKTSADKSPEAVKKYLNQVAEAFEKHVAPIQKDDLDHFLEILNSGEFERLSELAKYREALLAAHDEIKELAVPQNLTWLHQRQIFYLSESARQIQALERAEVDPVTALVVVPQRFDLKIEVIKLYRGELKVWLDAQKIQLTPEEKAYYLIN